MKVYALYIKTEEEGKFKLFDDEFYLCADAKEGDNVVTLLKISVDQKELWKYIIFQGYSSEDVEVVELEIEEVK